MQSREFRYHHLPNAQAYFLGKTDRQSILTYWSLTAPLNRPKYFEDVVGDPLAHNVVKNIESLVEGLMGIYMGILSLPDHANIIMTTLPDETCRLCVVGSHCHEQPVIDEDIYVAHQVFAHVKTLSIPLPEPTQLGYSTTIKLGDLKTIFKHAKLNKRVSPASPSP